MASAEHASASPTKEVRRVDSSVTGISGPALIIGAVLLVVAAWIGRSNDAMPRFWHAYLMNFAYIASLAIGALFFVLASHLFGARWATPVRRLAEIVAGTLPVVAILFVPMAVFLLNDNSGALYPWANREMMQNDHLLSGKMDYLSPFWFVVRTAICFTIWILSARLMLRGSLKVDETGSVASLRRLQKLSGPLMVAFALSLNVAAFDWLMSLDPIWFSTMFGVYYWVGGFLGFLALLMLMIRFLNARGVLTESVRVEQRHDVAKLMFAMVVFWGYIAFSQFMLIWYANIPEETKWFADRQSEPTEMGISTATALLFIFHLFIPFLGFMSKRIRRNAPLMAMWAVYILVVHWIDLCYIVMPTLNVTKRLTGLDPGGVQFGPLEALCLGGMACVLAGAIARGLGDRWLIPVRDPRMHQAMTYTNV